MNVPPDTASTRALAVLMEQARNHVITPEEAAEQRVSFVYGCLGGAATKDQVRAAIQRIYSPVDFR